MTLDQLHASGFDASTADDDGRHLSVRCSQCAALVISGTACHEPGCPHETHACRACDARIPTGARLCLDCAWATDPFDDDDPDTGPAPLWEDIPSE